MSEFASRTETVVADAYAERRSLDLAFQRAILCLRRTSSCICECADSGGDGMELAIGKRDGTRNKSFMEDIVTLRDGCQRVILWGLRCSPDKGASWSGKSLRCRRMMIKSWFRRIDILPLEA